MLPALERVARRDGVPCQAAAVENAAEMTRTEKSAFVWIVYGEDWRPGWKRLGLAAAGYLQGVFAAASACRRLHPDVDRVLLLERDSVPNRILKALRKGRLFTAVLKVTEISFDWGLWKDSASYRHRGVFGKLHAMEQVRYNRVVVLDADALPVASLEGLLDPQLLPLESLPAAMRTPNGVDPDEAVAAHGEWVRIGYGGRKINAGVLVLRPFRGERDAVAHEIRRDRPTGTNGEPAPVFGLPMDATSCPEEEVLSRYWSRCGVTNLGPEYNFETLDVGSKWPAPYYWAPLFAAARARVLAIPEGGVRVLHYVCEWAKPWKFSRCPAEGPSDEERRRHEDVLQWYLREQDDFYGDHSGPDGLGVFHYALHFWLREWRLVAATPEWALVDEAISKVEGWRWSEGELCPACQAWHRESWRAKQHRKWEHFVESLLIRATGGGEAVLRCKMSPRAEVFPETGCTWPSFADEAGRGAPHEDVLPETGGTR